MTDVPSRHGLSLRDESDLDRLPLDPATRERDRAAARAYAVRAPRRYLELIDWDDPADPVRAQVIPRAEELRWDEREREDLAFGYRERVTDTHLPHIAGLPAALPGLFAACLLYTSPSPRDRTRSRMPSSA